MKKGDNLLKGLQSFGDLAVKNMQQALKTGKKDSSGALSDSIEAVLTENNGVVDIALEMNYYGTYVDEGRKRGKFPPPPAIKDWIKQKPISLKKISLDAATYLIGKKIHDKGIEPFPFIEKSIDNAFEEGEDLVLDAVEDEVAFTIEESFAKNINIK